MTSDWVKEAFSMRIDKTVEKPQDFFTNNKTVKSRRSGKHYLVLVTYTNGQQEICGSYSYSKLEAKHACKQYIQKTNVKYCTVIRDPKEVGGKIIRG